VSGGALAGAAGRGSAEVRAYLGTRRGLIRLWFGFLGAAIAWLLHLFVAYMLVGYACELDRTILIHAASALLLGLAVLAGWVSRGTWRAVAGPAGRAGEDPLVRSRWMAIVGMLAAGWFTVVIVAQWIPVFLIPPCR
jgi:hypothetical protein